MIRLIAFLLVSFHLNAAAAVDCQYDWNGDKLSCYGTQPSYCQYDWNKNKGACAPRAITAETYYCAKLDKTNCL